MLAGNRCRVGLVFGLVWVVGLMRAQQPSSANGTGSVTGHVTCGDTQRPGRFASVVLFGVPAAVTVQPKVDPEMMDETAMATAMAEAMKSMGRTNMVQTQTGTDGGFVATDVAPGDYYVFASAPGYVSPLNQVQGAYRAGADMTKRLPNVPVLHVTADRTATQDVTMQRGAAISGTISWDDGSPMTGAMMALLPTKGEAGKPPSQFGLLAMSGNLLSLVSVSDDLGHYRISGLVPGEYLVQATIQAGGQSGIGSSMNLGKMMAMSPLVMFAPGTFHKTAAKAVSLHAGEDLRDQNLTLNLSGLHSVSGRVASMEDHHGINSATVKLQDANDKEFARRAPVDAAGNFTVTFVPPGTYTMEVTGAADTEPKKKDDKEKAPAFSFSTDKTLRIYQNGKMGVTVGDRDLVGQNVELAVDKNPKKEVDFTKVFGGMAPPDR